MRIGEVATSSYCGRGRTKGAAVPGLSGYVLLFVAAAALLFSGQAHAQNPNASLSGVVTDASGAVIPGASITVTDLNKGVKYQASSNSDGLYRVNALLPGTYSVEAAHDGFSPTTQSGVELHVEDQVSLNFTLKIGSQSETVTVEAGGPLIETQTATLGEVIEGRRVEDTPLNGRNPMNLIALVPTVVPQGTTGGTAAANQSTGFSNPAGYGNYQIGGGIAGWNATYLDGVPLNIISGQNWQGIIPTQDSVGEFKVDTNSVSPQYGRFSGGVTNFSTRSGTNSFHGNVYDYLRNTVFNANDYFTKQVGGPRGVLQQNQFGAALGGPILKDKAFFFFSYEGVRIASSSTYRALVPDAAFLSGDFSSYPGASSSKPFTDPATGQPANFNGQPNHIDPANFNSTALAMVQLGYFAPANAPQLKPTFNATGTTKQANNSGQYVTRIDEQISSKQRLFGRYTDWRITIPPPGGQTASPLIPGGGLKTKSNSIVVGDDYVFSNSLTGDLRIGYLRYVYNVGLSGNGNPNLAALGPAYVALGALEPVKAYPTLFPVGLATWPNAPNTLNLLQTYTMNNYSLAGSLTKVVKLHTLTLGGEARRQEWSPRVSIEPGGNFLFLGQNPMINFLEGRLQSNPGLGNINIAARRYITTYYQGYYVNDTWNALPKLTLNIGLRYELPGGFYTRGDADTVLLRNKPSTLGSIVNPVTGATQALVGQLAVVNSPDYPSRSQTKLHYDLFEPRVGIAFSARPSMVIRIGFGISHPCLDCGGAAPSASAVNSAITTYGTNLSNPFPGGINQPLGHNTNINLPATQFAQTLQGTSISGQEPVQTYPYTMQWNANVEQQLSSSASLSLSYVGSRTLHMGTQAINLDQLPDQYDALGPQLQQLVNNPLRGQVSATSSIGTSSTLPYGHFLQPFPQYQNVFSSGHYQGQAIYHGLSVLARKRLKGGASINVAYTWAHFISNEDSANGFLEGGGQGQTGFGPQDYTNPAGDISNSAADVRHRAVISYIYDLPFGRGRYFLHDAGPWVDRLVGGWNLSGITTFQTGLPIGVTYGAGTVLQSTFGAGQARPNVLPGCNKLITGSAKSKLGHWFNTSCFAAPSAFGFGNESRLDGQVRSDATDNFDLSLQKSVALERGAAIQFRAEFFNIANHPRFAAPDGNFSSGTFGQVTATANQPRIGQLALRLNF